ncbi:haloacid dehalogenase [Hyphomonas sp.]|uniref:KdsC family phosphatase n=1 Tax=Hyphomonas sp. TaxID=87 RepID=UPI001BD1B13A|nr:haloacid dehalogenase [Hyphomonas sp.]
MQSSSRALTHPEFAERARKVRLLAIDFDGVMTDNYVYVSEDGTEVVRCSRLEGYGLRRAMAAGVHCVIISTEENPVVSARARKLKIACHQGVEDKVAALEALLSEHGFGFQDAAFIGNDINDLGVLGKVHLPVIVADAHEDLDTLTAFRTLKPGGQGAVREVCDAIAAAKGG